MVSQPGGMVSQAVGMTSRAGGIASQARGMASRAGEESQPPEASRLPGSATAAPARLTSPAGAAVGAETQPGILDLPRNYIRSMSFTLPYRCDNSRRSPMRFEREPENLFALWRPGSLCGALARGNLRDHRG